MKVAVLAVLHSSFHHHSSSSSAAFHVFLFCSSLPLSSNDASHVEAVLVEACRRHWSLRALPFSGKRGIFPPLVMDIQYVLVGSKNLPSLANGLRIHLLRAPMLTRSSGIHACSVQYCSVLVGKGSWQEGGSLCSSHHSTMLNLANEPVGAASKSIPSVLCRRKA
jgi:hypothetical protein